MNQATNRISTSGFGKYGNRSIPQWGGNLAYPYEPATFTAKNRVVGATYDNAGDMTLARAGLAMS